jgi:FAD/FMN-containing dehydrogenase
MAVGEAFAQASRQLRASTGHVRLRKGTSNLFRSRNPAPNELDLSEFSQVIEVDVPSRTALVGGLTTYEDLVDATLAHGLVPLCVPQLRTITLGGAVTGLGIEAASLRNGCPHESVLAMDVLTGTGEVVHATADNEHADLFFGFPNSYGSLGYALRLQIELEPVKPFVALEHLRFHDAAELARVISDPPEFDYLDGTLFSEDEMYLTVGRYVDEGVPSDYTGQGIYYRSIQQRRTDTLTIHDYLWRWDTDWFWCSAAFGVQRPLVRRLWPDRWKRSDVYWKIIAADRRHQISARADRLRRRPVKETVVQDVEVPLPELAGFLDFFHREVGITPVWLCPLRQRDPRRTWTLYEFDPQTTYVNVGFWSRVDLPPGADPQTGRVNRAIERAVAELGGRKSLYSTSFYSRDEFYEIYGGAAYAQLKQRYDPGERFPHLYEKTCKGAT